MSGWKVGAIAALVSIAVVALVIVFARKVREGMNEAFAGFGIQMSILIGAPPDLEVAPDTPGYHESLDTKGPQRHYYDKRLDRTTIAAEIRLDGQSFGMPVAEYDGPPSREVAPDRLRRLDPPGGVPSVVHVRVVDAEGRPRRQVGVCWTDPRDPEHYGSSFGDAGEAVFHLPPGTWAIGIEGGPRYEVTLGVTEVVVCTLGPNGLVIERREKAR